VISWLVMDDGSLVPRNRPRGPLTPSLCPHAMGESKADSLLDLSHGGRPQTGLVNVTLPIATSPRATHLSVKDARHYHEIRLLEPVDVALFATELFTEDPGTGHDPFFHAIRCPRPIGRVSATVIPPAELATIVHPRFPTPTSTELTVSSPPTWTQHELAVDGADSRVLPRRPLRNPRRRLVANRSWMADLPHPADAPTTKLVHKARRWGVGGGGREPVEWVHAAPFHLIRDLMNNASANQPEGDNVSNAARTQQPTGTP